MPTDVPSDIVLSVLAPTYNERECIARFVAEATSELAVLGVPYELICVDDGSTDGTVEILRALAREDECLRVLTLAEHAGKCAALEAGIAAARGAVIGTIDADLQNDPRDFGPMLAAWRGSAAPTCVVGWRTRRRDNLLRRLSSRIANWLSGWLTGDDTHDAACGMKLAPANVWRALPMFEGMHRFVGPLARLYGAKIVEVAINHRPRYAGRSKYGSGLGRTFRALRDAFGVRWLANRRHTAQQMSAPAVSSYVPVRSLPSSGA